MLVAKSTRFNFLCMQSFLHQFKFEVNVHNRVNQQPPCSSHKRSMTAQAGERSRRLICNMWKQQEQFVHPNVSSASSCRLSDQCHTRTQPSAPAPMFLISPRQLSLTFKSCECILNSFSALPALLIGALSTQSDPAVSQISKFSSLKL